MFKPSSMDWAKIVGANIRRHRLAKKMSQEDLAGEAGIAMRHLGRVERAEVSPTVETLAKLATALHLQPADFFSVS